ncbi:MAG TPA: DUF4013 domain-containing protein, partial [Gemmataceae bacterium]|nr:DUF4013 domain-containing protein [Gemmataceae bacterium]
YLRNNPGWFGNAFLTGIAAIIPVVGGIAGQGYLFEVVRYLNRKGDSSYPSFEFGRFGDYLGRGIWPVLAALLVGIPLGVLAGILEAVLSMAIHSQAVSGVVVLFEIVAMFVMVPFSLYAGLSRSLALGAMFRFLQDFYKRVAVETIVGLIVVGLINFVLYFVGILACCVGIIPAIGLITLTSAHLFHQLYQLYLARGGQPVPVR